MLRDMLRDIVLSVYCLICVMIDDRSQT